MNELLFITIIMFSTCVYGGFILYFCRYLRTRGITELRFFETLLLAMFGNVVNFYKIFYKAHSQEYGKCKTKMLIIGHLSSVALIIATLIYAISVEGFY